MHIAIVGSTGAVGKELLHLLKEREFPCSTLDLFDSKTPPCFDGVDLAFFCVKKETALKWIPQAQAAGALCIDASTAYRLSSGIPLVIPEINEEALQKHQGIIASPNCTTTILLLPLAPLHRHFTIKRIVAATYQAVSGAGAQAIEELKNQTQARLEGKSLKPHCFPHLCAFNVFPHESAGLEEKKIANETKKILDETISVSAICMRVPTFRVHGVALNVEFAKPFDLDEVHQVLKKAPGVQYLEAPTSIDAAEKNEVFYGRMRMDSSQSNTIEMWIVGDQLLKGAALNMIQIAERCYAKTY